MISTRSGVLPTLTVLADTKEMISVVINRQKSAGRTIPRLAGKIAFLIVAPDTNFIRIERD
jgi:hypothetical protein